MVQANGVVPVRGRERTHERRPSLSHRLLHRPLGRRSYASTWDLQLQVREKLKGGLDAEPDVLLTVEHPPVLTAGRRAGPKNLLLSPEEARALGVDIQHIERGGDWTYHGPGQLVAYPIVALRRRGLSVKGYVAALEDAMQSVASRILTAAGCDGIVTLRRRCGAPGLWAMRADETEMKLGAVGVHVSRGVTIHGLALNLNTEPWGFSWIVPCGLVGAETSSLGRLVREFGGDEAAIPTVEEAGQWLMDVLPSCLLAHARGGRVRGDSVPST